MGVTAAEDKVITFVGIVAMDVSDPFPQLFCGVLGSTEAPVVPFRMAHVPACSHSTAFDDLRQLIGRVSDTDQSLVLVGLYLEFSNGANL